MADMKASVPGNHKTGKAFEIVRATKKDDPGIMVGGKYYEYGPNGTMYVRDPGVANEIEKELGHIKGTGDVVVSPVEFRDSIHRYRWFTIGVPWQRKDDGRWEEYAPGKWKLRTV
jgi:hypothetical protein